MNFVRQRTTQRKYLLTYRGVSYTFTDDLQLSNLRIANQNHLLTYRGVTYTVRRDCNAS